MITKSIISLFLSLPFFKEFSISDENLKSIKGLASYIVQIGCYVDLNALVDTVELFFILLLFVILANIIRAVI